MGISGIQVPYCTGRNIPSHTIPQDACDCHHHIYDPAHFPYRPEDTKNQPPADTASYKLLQKKLGTSRSVVIQPSAYGTDNRCTLDAMEKLGKQNTRAVVVLDHTVSDRELAAMHEQGVRGIRFNIASGGGPSGLAEIRSLAERIAPLSWSVSFFMNAENLISMESFLRSLPCDVILDHRAHIPADQGVNHPAFPVVCRLLEENKIWIKLSALYIDSHKPDYSDSAALGKALCRINPDRCLWGSDWPHPLLYESRSEFPNDADMLDILFDQAGDEDTFRKILVDNPARAYGF